MRLVVAALALLLAAAVAAPPASAHTPGAPPVGAAGSFTLTPAGTNNSNLHDFLSAFQLPISVGDTLQFSWLVDNGSGPWIDFEIHSHGGVQGYVRYYNATAASDNDTFVIPQDTSLMVWFSNPWNLTLNVTYSFVLFAPPPDVSPYILLMAVTIGAAIGWMWWVRAGGGAEESPGEEDEPREKKPSPAEDSEGAAPSSEDA